MGDSARPGGEHESRFDELARQLADGSISRRQAVGGIGAAAAAILLSPIGAAFGRDPDCPGGRVRCEGKCCPRGARCRKGKCRCPKGETKCGKRCVNTKNAEKHCGGCGQRCADGEACLEGTCRGTAPDPVCGNGVLEGAEQCDGANLGGQTCVGLGFIGGTLACGPNCTFNTAGCTGPPQAVCGNGAIETPEQCDGANLGGQTCVGLGFIGGTLACGPNCTFDTTGCTPPQCVTAADCPAAMPCQQAVCNAGTCGSVPIGNGTACDDGNPCTLNGICQGGVCTGTAVVCSASDQCHNAGTCDPQTGQCSNPPKPDGTACSDGDACTQSDICVAGVCQGGSPVTCPPPDPCHLAGTCNPATGQCTNPQAPNGTPCPGGGTCVNGVCTI